jgi:hypothetical protein
MLLEAKLGVGVQVLPPGGHFAVKQIDEMWNLHEEAPSTRMHIRGNFSPRAEMGNLASCE